MQIEDSSACAVCADHRLAAIDAQRIDGVSAREIAATFDLDLKLALQHAWHSWVAPKRRDNRRRRKYRNSLRLDEDGASAWLKLLPFKLNLWTRVDLADLSSVQRFAWRTYRERGGNYRAMRESRHREALSRVIMGVTDRRQIVDHINHDVLDNRRANLRVVTQAQNNQNRRGAMRGSYSGIRGVHRHQSTKQSGVYTYWCATVRSQGHCHTRQFPFTDEGLGAASAWVSAKRRELMPYSSADQAL